MSSVDGLRADIVWEANTGQAIADLGAVGDEYARTTGAMSDQALRMAAAQDRLTASIARSGPESRAAKAATLAYRQELAGLVEEADAASAAVTRQAEASARASKLATDAALKNQLAAARSVGRTLTTYVTVPTVLVGAAAVKMGFDFEESLRLIQTQAGATASEVDHMSTGVLDLVKSGQSFGQTANEMAKGLFSIESEGIRGAKALQVLRIAAAGAAVGQTDLAQTANALTSVMRVYDLDANHAASAMATLNAAVGAGKLHMEDLNAALATKFLPTAKQLGITLPQALAALDVFTKAGIPANVAANNLTTSFIKFEAPTKAAAGSFKQLGLSTHQLADDLQRGGLPAALADLVKGYQALEQTQGKVAANQAVFGAFGGARGGAPVLALVQQYQSYLKGLQQVQKQANPATFWTQVAATMNLPSQKVREDIAKITGELVTLGNTLAPIAAEVIGAADKILAAFHGLPGPIKAELGVIIGVLAVGGPLLVAIASTVRAVHTIGGAFKTVPAAAGRAVATTDAELATMSATATAEGAAAGTGLATGVEAGTAEAAASVSALRLSILGLGALAVAPIVIPIVIEETHKIVGDIHGRNFGKLVRDELGFGEKYIGPAFGIHSYDHGKGGGGPGPSPNTGDATSFITGVPGSKKHPFAYPQPRRRRERPPFTVGPAGGGGGGGGFTTEIPIDLQIQVARAEYDKNLAGERKALEAEKTFLEHELQLAKTKKQRLAAIQALQAVQGQLDSVAGEVASRRSEAAQRRSAADSRKESALDARISGAQSAERSAKSVERERAAYERERNARRLLLALYERESKDATLTRSQRATAERKAAAERKQLAAIDDRSRQDGLDLAVLRAKNAVAAATVGSKAYDQAIAAEKRALDREIAYDHARAHNAKLSLAARKKALEEELAARKQLAHLGKQTKEAGAANERQFLSEFAAITGSFGSNATPIDKHSGRMATHLYELVHDQRQQTSILKAMAQAGRFGGTDDALAASLAVT